MAPTRTRNLLVAVTSALRDLRLAPPLVMLRPSVATVVWGVMLSINIHAVPANLEENHDDRSRTGIGEGLSIVSRQRLIALGSVNDLTPILATKRLLHC